MIDAMSIISKPREVLQDDLIVRRKMQFYEKCGFGAKEIRWQSITRTTEDTGIRTYENENNKSSSNKRDGIMKLNNGDKNKNNENSGVRLRRARGRKAREEESRTQREQTMGSWKSEGVEPNRVLFGRRLSIPRCIFCEHIQLRVRKIIFKLQLTSKLISHLLQRPLLNCFTRELSLYFFLLFTSRLFIFFSFCSDFR